MGEHLAGRGGGRRGKQSQELILPALPWDLRYQTFQHLHQRCSPRAGGSERMFGQNEVEGESRDGTAGR